MPPLPQHADIASPDVDRLRDLLAAQPDAIVTISTFAGRMLWSSEAGSVAMFQRHPHDFQGDDIWRYIDRRDHEQVRAALSEVADGGTVTFEYRAVTASGSWVPVTNVAWPATVNGERVALHVARPSSAIRRPPPPRTWRQTPPVIR